MAVASSCSTAARTALTAQAKQRHVIHIDAEVMFPGDRFDEHRQRRVIDLLDCITLAADEMMMRRVARDLIVRAIAPVQGVNQPQLAQEIQRTIDRRTADGRVLVVHAGIHLFRRDVRSGLTNDVQDEMPLWRQSISLGVKLIGKINLCA